MPPKGFHSWQQRLLGQSGRGPHRQQTPVGQRQCGGQDPAGGGGLLTGIVLALGAALALGLTGFGQRHLAALGAKDTSGPPRRGQSLDHGALGRRRQRQHRQVLEEAGGIAARCFALLGDKIGQIHHLAAVAAGKDPRHGGLQKGIGGGAIGGGIQRDTCLRRDLVFRDQSHREQKGVTGYLPFRAGQGAALWVGLRQFCAFDPSASHDPCDGVLKEQGDAEVIEALAHVALQAAGQGILFHHRQDLCTFQRQAAGHDQPDVARPQDQHPTAHQKIFRVDQVLCGAGGIDPRRTGARNGETAPGPLPAAGGQDHGTGRKSEKPLAGRHCKV